MSNIHFSQNGAVSPRGEMGQTSDTPRTDHEISVTDIKCDDSCCGVYVFRDGKETDEHIVTSRFARQLERELNEANAKLSAITNSADILSMAETIARQQKQLESLKVVADGLAHELERKGASLGCECGWSDCIALNNFTRWKQENP